MGLYDYDGSAQGGGYNNGTTPQYPPAPAPAPAPAAAPAPPAPAPAPAPAPVGAPPPISLNYPAPAPAPGMVAGAMEGGTVTPLPQVHPTAEAPAPGYVAPPNPFSTAPAAKVDTSGLIGSAMSTPQVTAPSTAANVAKVDPSSYTGAAPAGTATATQAVGTGYDANHWNVDDPQTVQGQIAAITAKDGELSQQARTRATQAAAQKGLINSTMAVQAGESAVLNAALPIAQQDATTYGSAAKTNAEVDNRAAEFGAAAGNTASLANANLGTDVSKANAGAANALQSQDIDNKSKAALTNASAENDAKARDAQLSLQSQLANQDAAVKQSMQQYDVAAKGAFQNADAETKLQLQNIDATTRSSLAEIEAKYKTQMQTSQSVASSYQSLVDNITRVMADKDMDAGAKQSAIDNLRVLYNNTLSMQSDISKLNLGSLLDPKDLAAPAAGSSAVTAANYANATANQDGSGRPRAPDDYSQNNFG